MGLRGNGDSRFATPSVAEIDDLERRRRDVRIDPIPGDRQSRKELAVFDIVVEGEGLIGRWCRTKGRAWVTWTDGSKFETSLCDDDPSKIREAVRPTVPLRPPSPAPLSAAPRGFPSLRAKARPPGETKR